MDYNRPLIAGLATLVVGFLVRPSIMSRILGFAKISWYHSPTQKSIKIVTKDGGNKTTFVELCQSIIPRCRLNPFLFNGHLQTIWTVLASYHIPVYYKRWTFENEDPTYRGTFAVDFVTKPYDDNVNNDINNDKEGEKLPPRTTYYTPDEFRQIRSDDTKPMLVTLHGLSGGSHELYLRHVLKDLITEDGGWEACVVNSRGCANSKITTNVLYNARATWDVRQTVKWLRKMFPNRPLFGLGFSLGAAIMANYVGEEGSDCELKAAVILSAPWNLDAGSIALQSSWMGLNVYSKAMGSSLKALFERHIEQVSKTPGIDVDAIRKLKYLHEFDRLVQGPTWGYPTEGAYYRDASACDVLLGVRIPLLAIHAEDDPVARKEGLPLQEFKQTPYGVLCTTNLGGHLSWFELGGGRWFSRAANAFLQEMARNVDLDELSKTCKAEANGDVDHTNRQPLKPFFEPARRKLHRPGE